LDTSINKKTVRELGGEVWAEITHRQNRISDDNLIGDIDFRVVQELSDILMGVLARHVGCTIINDEDLPVTPLKDNPTLTG